MRRPCAEPLGRANAFRHLWRRSCDTDSRHGRAKTTGKVYQGPLTYQDRQPAWSRQAMIAPASGAAPRTLGPRAGRLQFTTYGFHGITPSTHGCADARGTAWLNSAGVAI